MVINFGSKIELWHCEIAGQKLAFKRHEADHTQLIKATSCVERLNVTIKAKELSYLSSYQMQTTDKN